jgi:hypothetical protein
MTENAMITSRRKQQTQLRKGVLCGNLSSTGYDTSKFCNTKL